MTDNEDSRTITRRDLKRGALGAAGLYAMPAPRDTEQPGSAARARTGDPASGLAVACVRYLRA